MVTFLFLIHPFCPLVSPFTHHHPLPLNPYPTSSTLAPLLFHNALKVIAYIKIIVLRRHNHHHTEQHILIGPRDPFRESFQAFPCFPPQAHGPT